MIMCNARNCKYSNQCYKYRKEPSDNQSYYNYEYECNVGSGFDYFECMLETKIDKDGGNGD